jgi:hypothetical protein
MSKRLKKMLADVPSNFKYGIFMYRDAKGDWKSATVGEPDLAQMQQALVHSLLNTHALITASLLRGAPAPEVVDDE